MKVCSEYSNFRLADDLESRLNGEFSAAIGQGLFSGASLLISIGRTPVFEQTWGRVRLEGAPVTASTRFDLASLTKPLVTAPLCMIAVEREILGLDDPLSRFFPGRAPEDKARITIRQLLAHSSGLPPYREFYPELVKLPVHARRDELLSMILRTPLSFDPGKTAQYSDLGFMVLGLILERQMGGRLDRLAGDFLFSPLGIEDLDFCPVDKWEGDEVGFAATQFCPWRKRLLFGEVDDENAWVLNGVAGHAGLFGTARGVFGLLSVLWSAYEGGTAPSPLEDPGGLGGASIRSLSGDIVRLFWTRARVAEGLSDWCLGFDTPSRKTPSSSGRHFSAKTVGHLGFTGVSFWLDLEKRALVILLTNRVHPTRQNDGIRQLRPILHDIIMETLT